MKTVNYKLTTKQIDKLHLSKPNFGKNADVGKIAVEIAKLYFEREYNSPSFIENNNGVDLTVSWGAMVEEYEIKGTVDPYIAFSKLKVSSQRVHDKLMNGLTLLRVCNIGKKEIVLHFMKYNEDFTMIPEPRWSVKKQFN
jgi:hypothetical protein